MSHPTTVQLCPHKMNPISCPTCYRNKPPEQKKVAPQQQSNMIPQGQVIPIGEATQRATMNMSRARMAAPQIAANNPNARALKEAHHDANPSPPPESYSPEDVWQPPQHQSLIVRVPKHPHLAQTKTQIRG